MESGRIDVSKRQLRESIIIR